MREGPDARVAMVTPFAPPSVRGNAITVGRIARGLREHGVALRAWDLSATPAPAVEAEVEAYAPTVVHAFHAYRTGPLALRLARRLDAPLVVTITGTDVNHDLLDVDRAAVVRGVLQAAGRIAVFDESIAARIHAALPDVAARTAVIPQGVWLPDGDGVDLQAWWPLPRERVLFLFPAGIRPVKAPLMPLRAFDGLVARHPQVRLLYVGPVIDRECAADLDRALATRPWARRLAAVPHERMASLLRAADVVLNASLSEGGMANSVLEAMAMERPVLASDIPGNRSLVQEGVTGFLFDGPDQLEKRAEWLVSAPQLRRRLGDAGRAVVDRLYPPHREIDGYAALYREVATAHHSRGGRGGRT